ncbi:ABC transporter ATP-binding protein [bacterium CPR1]|nr:ABC transporter ATP-binding protein [bacterium CPR1]
MLALRGLTTRFATEQGKLTAIDGVSFELYPGQTLAVVGESGSGKSVCAMSILGLIAPPGKVEAGTIEFEGLNLRELPPAEMRRLRGNRLAMIFQDPLTALNPVLTVGRQVAEPLAVHRGLRGTALRLAAIELLARVQIPEPALRVDDYPHQFSGGMRQRVVIAMALACDPAVLIADEPTTALDVTIQAQILALLREIRRQSNSAVLLITHDMGVVAQESDETAVMYAGQVIERAATARLFSQPRHPYTAGLIASVPRLDRAPGRLPAIPGQPPDLRALPDGCLFAPRCSMAQDRCHSQRPALAELDPGHFSACFFADRVA